MRYSVLVLSSTLLACQPTSITKELPAEAQAQPPFEPMTAEFVPAVIVPAGQSTTAARTHLGHVIGPHSMQFDQSTVHMMAGADVVASDENYWELHMGTFSSGAWNPIVTVTTQLPASGGMGDLYGGSWYELPNPPNAIGWVTVLAVHAVPHGEPAADSFVFALPGFSIGP